MESMPWLPLTHARHIAELDGLYGLTDNVLTWWRRGESNPRPKSLTVESLHAYRVHLPLSPAALWNAQERTAGQPDPVARISPGTLRRQVPSQPAGWRLSPPCGRERRRRATL